MKPLPLAAAWTFQQPPEALRAKVLRLVDPARGGVRPLPGRRLVAVEVAVTNVGSRTLYAGSAHCTLFGRVTLADARGGRRSSRKGLEPDLARFFAPSSNPYVEARALVPGQTVTGYYTFELRGAVRATLFSLAPCRAIPAARWRLQ